MNRLKIIKGWKTPYLPTKTLNYSRDISLWFKVYLLLKLFLNLKKIQLLSCEIRFEQQNKKILYLVINKKKTQKKKRKKRKVSFKKIQTPVRKMINTQSIFYLYKNLSSLKRSSFWNQNVVHKKILSKFWLTKPKISTWINTLDKVKSMREASKNKLKFLQKNKNFTPIQHIKLKFYTNKQKQILAQKLKIKKINTLLYAKLFELSQQSKSQFLQKLIFNLKKKIDKNKNEIKKINKIYTLFLILNQKQDLNKKSNYSFKKLIVTRVQRKKIIILLKLLKTQFHSLNRTRFLKRKLLTFLLKTNKNLFPSTHAVFFKKELLLKNVLQLNFLMAQIHNQKILIKNHALLSNSKAQFEKKRNIKKDVAKPKVFLKNLYLKQILNLKFRKITRKKPVRYRCYQIHAWFLLRKKKKKKRRNRIYKKVNKSFKLRLKTNSFRKYIFFENEKSFNTNQKKLRLAKKLQEINNSVKKNQTLKHYQYRLPYRKVYFNFLQLNTKLKLKYLIQNFVQKYFSLQVEAKIVHFLNAYKNKNYFRLVFPVWKKKKNQLIRKFRQGNWKQKQIFLASQLQIINTTKQISTHSAKNKYIAKTLKKKDLYILARRKIKNSRVKNSFKRIKGSKDFRHSFKYFIPSLMYFTRTLDPQILVELLAKVVYKAKKQTWMLSTIKDILKMIKLGRNVGYKIALAGRINSADKSRLIYITKKNVPLQVFDKNMNFAYSQAEARIGVFGIKIWVYF